MGGVLFSSVVTCFLCYVLSSYLNVKCHSNIHEYVGLGSANAVDKCKCVQCWSVTRALTNNLKTQNNTTTKWKCWSYIVHIPTPKSKFSVVCWFYLYFVHGKGRKQNLNYKSFSYDVTPAILVNRNNSCNLVPRVFSLSNMAAVGEKTLAHSELKRSLIGAFHYSFILALSLVYTFQNKDGYPLRAS